MTFIYEKFIIEFSDENESDDGDAGRLRFLRLYCLDAEQNELASLCTTIPIDAGPQFLSNVSLQLNQVLLENDDQSIFRAIDKFMANVDKTYQKSQALTDNYLETNEEIKYERSKK